jgi:hypothetical protein
VTSPWLLGAVLASLGDFMLPIGLAAGGADVAGPDRGFSDKSRMLSMYSYFSDQPFMSPFRSPFVRFSRSSSRVPFLRWMGISACLATAHRFPTKGAVSPHCIQPSELERKAVLTRRELDGKGRRASCGVLPAPVSIVLVPLPLPLPLPGSGGER